MSRKQHEAGEITCNNSKKIQRARAAFWLNGTSTLHLEPKHHDVDLSIENDHPRLVGGLCDFRPWCAAHSTDNACAGQRYCESVPGLFMERSPGRFQGHWQAAGLSDPNRRRWGFTTSIDEDRVALNRYVHDEPLAPGSYHWRVRAIPHAEEPEEWSQLAVFVIHKPELMVTVDASEDPVQGVARAVEKVKPAKATPTLRSDPMAFSGASHRKQIPCKQ